MSKIIEFTLFVVYPLTITAVLLKLPIAILTLLGVGITLHIGAIGLHLFQRIYSQKTQGIS